MQRCLTSTNLKIQTKNKVHKDTDISVKDKYYILIKMKSVYKLWGSILSFKLIHFKEERQGAVHFLFCMVNVQNIPISLEKQYRL